MSLTPVYCLSITRSVMLRQVIRSFGNKATERLWRRERSKGLDPRIERVALRKLACLTPPRSSMTYECRRAIDWRHYGEAGPASTAYGSTNGGESASPGPPPVRNTSRSLTTTRRQTA